MLPRVELLAEANMARLRDEKGNFKVVNASSVVGALAAIEIGSAAAGAATGGATTGSGNFGPLSHFPSAEAKPKVPYLNIFDKKLISLH